MRAVAASPYRGLVVATLLSSLAFLSGCDDGGSSRPAAPGPDPVETFSQEELESPGPLLFDEADQKITNSSGKGEAFIPARAYTPVDEGLYPLIVILPGFSGTFENYAPYSQHFASHGAVVLAVTFTGSGFTNIDGQNDLLLIQVKDSIEHALAEFTDKIDEARIGIVGHSQGGKMAFYAASEFNGMNPGLPHVSLAVGLDPVNSGGAPCFIFPLECVKYPVAPNPLNGDIGILDGMNAASLILRSEPDATSPDPQFNAALFYQGYDGEGLHGVPSPALYVDMGDAPHVAYVDLPDSDNSVPVFARRTTTAWIKRHFEGSMNLDDFFTGAYMQEDIDAGVVVSVEER
ncbi:MAG: alpha/beta fold hydrolase [Halioglobus sp.]